MTLEETQEEIKKLELRACNISDIKDAISKELHIKLLLSEYIKVNPRTSLEHYVKMALMDFLYDKDPFPLTTEEFKPKAGAPENKRVTGAKVSYYLFKTNGSIRKTSELLKIDRKTVKSKYQYASKVAEEIKAGIYPPEKLKLLCKMGDDSFLDDFNADLIRHENKNIMG